MRIINVDQGTAEWLEARMGIPTASNFHKIITPKTLKLSEQRHDYKSRLLAEWLLGESMEEEFNTYAIERGTELEDRARAWYEQHSEAAIVQIGFVLRDDGAIGCSPDGLIVDGEKVVGGLELKVPLAPKCVSYLTGDKKLGTEEHKMQVQGSLYVTGLPWWDCLVWHPAMSRILPTLVRIEPDREVFAAFDEFIPIFLNDLAQAKAYLVDEVGCKPKGLPVNFAEIIR